MKKLLLFTFAATLLFATGTTTLTAQTPAQKNASAAILTYTGTYEGKKHTLKLYKGSKFEMTSKDIITGELRKETGRWEIIDYNQFIVLYGEYVTEGFKRDGKRLIACTEDKQVYVDEDGASNILTLLE